MKIEWRKFLQHYLLMAVFCLAIAAITSTIWPNKTYLEQLGYSLCVGTVIWLVVELGRFPLRRPSDPTGWPMGWRGVMLIAVGIAAGYFLGTMLGDLFFGGSGNPSWIESRRDKRLSLMITVAAGVIGSYFFYSRGHRAALAARVSKAERDASEARLKLLETQLEPHMLFNTLANLRALIATDPPRAIAMLDRLNNYLRATLSGSRTLAHPLAAEFERLADYLELMAVRMGPRLVFTLVLPPDLCDQMVPPLILQPLVENSIRHGLEPKVEGGEIIVRAQRQGDAQLIIEVCDTGVGIGDAQACIAENGNFGLTHVRERLATVYGARGTLKLSSTIGGGTLATLLVPIQS